MKKIIFALFVGLLGFVTRSQATVNIDVTQVGSDVVFTTSGSLDLTGASLVTPLDGAFGLGFISGGSNWYVGQGSGSAYTSYAMTSYDGAFGTSPAYYSSPTSSIGDNFFIWGNGGTDPRQVGVRYGYVSGASISAVMVFAGTNIDGLFLTPGVYSYNLPSDSVILNIGGTVPDSGTTVALLGLAMAGMAAFRRRNR